MEKISQSIVAELLAQNTRPTVTIYLPMHVGASPPHITENQIRFKNLLHEAITCVRDEYGDQKFADELNAYMTRTLEQRDFWDAKAAGMLLCASPAHGIRVFQLPIDTESYMAVDEHYHLAPVIGLLEDNRDFYVLTLAQQHPMLFRGSVYGLAPSGLELPKSVHEALNLDEYSPSTESQNSAYAGGFNGRGGGKDPNEADRVRFFRMIDKVVTAKADRNLPFILAGTESEIAEYRGVSKQLCILDGSISGNQAKVELTALFQQASVIIWRELVLPMHRAAIEEYEQSRGANPERVAHDSESITLAADAGRVDKLLTNSCRQTTDNVSDQLESQPQLTFPNPKLAKQLNDIAATVFGARGTVINLTSEEMPTNDLMLARLRY